MQEKSTRERENVRRKHKRREEKSCSKSAWRKFSREGKKKYKSRWGEGRV
jgi:cysteinyl-tRNA synthetase